MCVCFQVAAGTLDASTKIYAVRVDAVHADAYRVLGGLGSETKPKDGVCRCLSASDVPALTMGYPDILYIAG